MTQTTTDEDSIKSARAVVELAGDDCCALIGCGDAIMMREIFEKLPETCALFIVESSLSKAERVAQYIPQEGRKVTAIVALDDPGIDARLQQLSFLWAYNDLKIILNPTRGGEENTEQEFTRAIAAAKQSIEITCTFDEKFKEETLRSIVRNYTRAAKGAKWQELAGQLDKRTILLIGAGPSLRDQLPEIRRNADKALILACDAALPILADHGIRPHLVASMDVIARKASIFKECGLPDVPLLTTLKANSELVAAWPGPVVFFCQDYAIEMWAATRLGGIPKTNPPGSIMPFMLNLAIAFEPEQVAMVGLDLCHADDGRFYCEGVTHWQGDDLERFKAAHNKGFVTTNSGKLLRAMKCSDQYAYSMSTFAGKTRVPIFTTAYDGMKLDRIPYRAIADVRVAIENQTTREAFVLTERDDTALLAEDIGELIEIVEQYRDGIEDVMWDVQSQDGLAWIEQAGEFISADSIGNRLCRAWSSRLIYNFSRAIRYKGITEDAWLEAFVLLGGMKNTAKLLLEELRRIDF